MPEQLSRWGPLYYGLVEFKPLPKVERIFSSIMDRSTSCLGNTFLRVILYRSDLQCFLIQSQLIRIQLQTEDWLIEQLANLYP